MLSEDRKRAHFLAALTVAGCAAGCSVAGWAGGWTWQWASSGPCSWTSGWGQSRLKASAAGWAAGPQCAAQCWVHSQPLQEMGVSAQTSPHMPSQWSQTCRHTAEAWGTFLHSGTEVCNWLKDKLTRSVKKREKKRRRVNADRWENKLATMVNKLRLRLDVMLRNVKCQPEDNN